MLSLAKNPGVVALVSIVIFLPISTMSPKFVVKNHLVLSFIIVASSMPSLSGLVTKSITLLDALDNTSQVKGNFW